MIFQIRQTIDIKKDNPVLEYKQGLDYGNNLAHEWLVFVEEDGALVDLASVAVTGYFLREDGVTVKVDGSVKNGACSVVFDRRCYLIEGAVKCAMVLTRGAEVVTSAKLRTNANQSITDQIIDTGDTIPTDIYDLLTQIDAMREATTATVAATAAANAAAQRANAGADRVEQLQIDASGLAGDALKLGGKPPEAYAAVNLLDNSDFSNPVNQRGQTSYSIKGGSEYTIDRWSVWFGESGTVTVSDGCLIITNTSPTAGGSLVQYFEKGTLDLSKTYTRVYEKDDGELVISHSSVYGETSVQSMQMYIPANTTVKIKRIALYEGAYTAETLPPFVPRPYAVELAECKRYYRRIKNAIVQVSPNIQAYYRASSIFYEEMRMAPTVTILVNESGQYGMCSNVAYITDVNDISIVNRENGCLGLATTKENYAGRTIQIYDIELSADL